MKVPFSSVTRETWEKTVAVVSVFTVVTSVASVGMVKYELRTKTHTSASGEPAPGSGDNGQGGGGPQASSGPSAGPSASASPGASGPGGSGGSGGSGGTSGSSGSGGSGGSGGGSGGSGGGSGSTGNRGPKFGLISQGVTDKTVRIGLPYNYSGCGQSGQVSAMFTPAQTGDPKKAATAMINYVNSHGGIGGRHVVGDYIDDGGGDETNCPGQAIAAAKKAATENHDFITLSSIYTESDWLIPRGYPDFGGRDDPDGIKREAPNGVGILEPQEPTFKRWISYGLNVLDTPHHTACLVHPENDGSGPWHDNATRLKKWAAERGMHFKDDIEYQNVVATAQQQASAAAARIKADGCDQVWIMSGNPIGWIFFTQAMTQANWFPTWTFTAYTVEADYDLAGHLMDQAQWRNAKGLSSRVPAGKGHGAEGNCARIYQQTYPTDGEQNGALTTAECILLLTMFQQMRNGVAITGHLDSDSWLIGANAIKGNFFADATVPTTYSFPVGGPYKTKAWDMMTDIHWDVPSQTYLFDSYPHYWRGDFTPHKGGWIDPSSSWLHYKPW